MARPFLLPSRKAADRVLRLYVLGLALVRRHRLAPAKSLRLPARRGMAAPLCPPAFRGRNFGKASAHIAPPPRAANPQGRPIALGQPLLSRTTAPATAMPKVFRFNKLSTKKPPPGGRRFYTLNNKIYVIILSPHDKFLLCRRCVHASGKFPQAGMKYPGSCGPYGLRVSSGSDR